MPTLPSHVAKTRLGTRSVNSEPFRFGASENTVPRATVPCSSIQASKSCVHV